MPGRWYQRHGRRAGGSCPQQLPGGIAAGALAASYAFTVPWRPHKWMRSFGAGSKRVRKGDRTTCLRASAASARPAAARRPPEDLMFFLVAARASEEGSGRRKAE